MKSVYHYDSVETIQKEGAGIFSGIGSIVNLINNKDFITSAAKGAATIGSTASAISNAVNSQNELKQLETIRKLLNDSEALKNLKKLSEETKNKIANIAVGETLRSGAPSDSKKGKKKGVAIERSIKEIRGNGVSSKPSV